MTFITTLIPEFSISLNRYRGLTGTIVNPIKSRRSYISSCCAIQGYGPQWLSGASRLWRHRPKVAARRGAPERWYKPQMSPHIQIDESSMSELSTVFRTTNSQDIVSESRSCALGPRTKYS